MTAERWELVKNLFESALNVSPSERASFLARECGGDDELLREVSSLLESHDETGHFMEAPVASVRGPISDTDPITDVPAGDDPMLGQRVGAYQLVKELGRGGMGAVYLAVRADNEFRKRVAIKLIRGGMESEFLIRRFRHERQILARLEHPNIARLLDGGTTPAGLPYFVMEYAEGEPLIRFCESRSLPIRERLAIFLRACSAVHYAHRRMIVHRDLKPGNILVKQDGIPKLLDFGIAKLLDPDTSDAAAETTLAGFRIVTPAYASPEQMRGEPATIRSDIYALGIILFELVTGKRPSAARLGEDPLSAADGAPDDTTRLLIRQLRSVVDRAIQPDAAARYESVEAFTADIRRAMAGVALPNYSTATTAIESIAPSPGSLAVLPFRLLGADSTSDGYLGLGITDAVITKLSNVGRISVRSTSAVMKYAGTLDPIAAGRELGVESVLEGRVQKIGDRVRVTVQLVQVQSGAPVWAASFDEHFEDLLRVEDSISEQVAQALVPQLTGEEREQLARAGTLSAKAHQAYLRGRWNWSKNTEESLAQALVAFMQAIAEDPQYARAHAGVADYYVQLGIRGGLPPSESFAAAKESAGAALRIDPGLAEAHASLGFAIWAYDRDPGTAAHHFQLAIALNPDYAPAHHWLGLLNSARGRPEMAVASLERARKLDPHRPVYAADLALCHYHARRFKQAAEVCENAIQSLGEDSELFSMLALSYAHDGQIEKAIPAARRAADLTGEDVFSLAVVAEIESLQGFRGRARAVLRQVEDRAQTRYVSGCVLALLHLAAGDKESALAQLERAWRDRDWWITWIGVGPSWDALRDDPRFKQLLAADGMGLPGTAGSQRETAIAAPLLAAPKRKRTPVWLAVAGLLIAGIAALLAYRAARGEASPFHRPNIAKLATNGTALRANISDDGRFVAYTSMREGRTVIWVRELNGAAAYRIAGPLEGDIRSLEFIRKGRYVSFLVYFMNEPAKGVLSAVPVGGGEVETLMANVPGPVSVSPDGSQIAFYRADPAQGADQLVVASPGGENEKVVASQRYPDRFSWEAAPAWSADGRQIAAALEGSDNSGYRIVPTVFDIGGSRRQVRSPRYQFIGRMVWMKNSEGLIVIGQEHEGSFAQIWYVPVARGEPVRISNDLNDYQSLGISGDGASLVSVQIQTLTNVYLQSPADPRRGVQITPGGGRYFDLAWTSDGKILYASDATGTADIWMMNADGSAQQMLTSGAGRSYSPAIAPDSRTVAFHTNRGGNWNIWKMDRDTRKPVQLTFGKRDSNWPQFTRDGQHIIYHHTGLNAMFNLWKVPAAGGAAVQITKELTMHPAVSRRDGRIAAWYSVDVARPHWKIAILPPEGGVPQKVFDVAGTVRPDSTLRWTASSDGVGYVDDRNGVSNIWVQPAAGGPPRQLTDFEWGQVYSFDWAPDGRMVYSRGMSTSDVVLIRDRRQ